LAVVGFRIMITMLNSESLRLLVNSSRYGDLTLTPTARDKQGSKGGTSAVQMAEVTGWLEREDLQYRKEVHRPISVAGGLEVKV
jgi:hypothetical protein